MRGQCNESPVFGIIEDNMTSFEYHFRRRADKDKLLEKYIAFDESVATALMVDFAACDTMMEL
jgi:hypothetical protein